MRRTRCVPSDEMAVDVDLGVVSGDSLSPKCDPSVRPWEGGKSRGGNRDAQHDRRYSSKTSCDEDAWLDITSHPEHTSARQKLKPR